MTIAFVILMPENVTKILAISAVVEFQDLICVNHDSDIFTETCLFALCSCCHRFVFHPHHADINFGVKPSCYELFESH